MIPHTTSARGAGENGGCRALCKECSSGPDEKLAREVKGRNDSRGGRYGLRLLGRFRLDSLPYFLDILVERGGFRLQSFPFAGTDICGKHLAFDARAFAFEMRQQFLVVFIKFANGSLDRASRRHPVVPPFASPPPHHTIMPQRLALAGLHPCQVVKKSSRCHPACPDAGREPPCGEGSAFSFGFCKYVPLATTGMTIKIHFSTTC